jgi:hypothetical protein
MRPSRTAGTDSSRTGIPAHDAVGELLLARQGCLDACLVGQARHADLARVPNDGATAVDPEGEQVGRVDPIRLRAAVVLVVTLCSQYAHQLALSAQAQLALEVRVARAHLDQHGRPQAGSEHHHRSSLRAKTEQHLLHGVRRA